jgi:hypothetical protein
MSSLETTERAAAENAALKGNAPRVSLETIEASIAYRYDTTGGKIVAFDPRNAGQVVSGQAMSLNVLSVCILVMKNGFCVIGKSAPAVGSNYDEQLGKNFAYEDAVRQLWPMMGYALREKLFLTNSLTSEGKSNPENTSGGSIAGG